MPLVEQELLTLPEHMNEGMVFNWGCVAHCLPSCSFSFVLAVLINHFDMVKRLSQIEYTY